MQIQRGIAIQPLQALPRDIEPTEWVQQVRQSHHPTTMVVESPMWTDALLPWIHAGFRVSAPFQEHTTGLTLCYRDDDSWRSRIQFLPLSMQWIDTIVRWFQSPAVKSFYAVHPYSDDEIYRRF